MMSRPMQWRLQRVPLLVQHTPSVHGCVSMQQQRARSQANASGASAAVALPEGFCIGCPAAPAGTPASAPYVKPGYLAAYNCCVVPPAASLAASDSSTAAVGVTIGLLLAAMDVVACSQMCQGVRALLLTAARRCRHVIMVRVLAMLRSGHEHVMVVLKNMLA